MCEKCGAIADLIEAECGKDSIAYAQGLLNVASIVVQSLLCDPELSDDNADAKLAIWVAVVTEAGIAVGMKHPKFAKKLLGVLHYGRQLTLDHVTTESAEALEEIIIAGLIQQEFGWDKEE